jgi:hypothetical protein
MAGRRQGRTARSQEGRRRRPGAAAAIERLARRLCPHRTDGQVEHELVPRAARRLTPDEARAHTTDRVAAVVARTCAWGEAFEDWDVGDYRFLVLDFSPKKDVGLYVQIWTEPGEPVLIEACSGAWNPAARPYVQAPQRSALRKLGYKVGGRARNYQKYWALSPTADARALAAELLSILIDVFGYRGQWPLDMTYCSEGRTETGQVFPSLAIDDVKRMLGMAGCQVVDAEPSRRVSRDVRRRLIHVAAPFPFVVEMRGQASKPPATYEAMRLVTPLPAGRGLPPELLEQLVRECPFGRTFRDEEGGLLFIADLVVVGTTVRWFLVALRVWMRMRRRAEEMLLFALTPPEPRADGGRGDAGGGGGGDGDDEGDAGDDVDDAGGDGEGPLQGRAARTVVH